jgi:hypothetical protein
MYLICNIKQYKCKTLSFIYISLPMSMYNSVKTCHFFLGRGGFEFMIGDRPIKVAHCKINMKLLDTPTLECTHN